MNKHENKSYHTEILRLLNSLKLKGKLSKNAELSSDINALDEYVQRYYNQDQQTKILDDCDINKKNNKDGVFIDL